MAREKLTYFDFVKAAFGWKYKIPLLGRMPVNIFALSGFGILGFGNPAFWFVGLAYEVGYLLFLAGSDRFQQVVLGTRLLEQKAVWTAKQDDLIKGLDQTSLKRYERLYQVCGSICKNAATTGGPADDLRAQGLAQLMWTFLQLLTSRLRISATLGQVSAKQLQDEIASINRRMEGKDASSPLYRSLQGSLDIANRRLDNLNRASESITVVDAELDRIEKQFALLQEETLVSSDPAALTARLDGLTQSLQDTSRWLAENTEFFKSFDEPVGPVAVPPLRQTVKE